MLSCRPVVSLSSGIRAFAFRLLAAPAVAALCLVAMALVGVTAPLEAQTATYTPNWVQQSPATSPSARYSAAMAYDTATGQVVLFGGDVSGVAIGDTWTYNGTTWTQQSPATSPPARYGSTMVYNTATGQVVLFGGYGSGSTLADTWTYNGTTWTQQSPATSPPARYESTMAYDTATGQMVLFGGFGSSGYLADTWTYNGTTWTQQSPATSPSARYSSTMAYDTATGQVVLFGGYGSSGYLADTWTYNGTTWTQQSPATSPSARYDSIMAYDTAAGQVVLFGGAASGGVAVGDTWTYNGTTWTQQSPATSPSARYVSSMAYDTATGQVVLFGGYGAHGNLNDTWTYVPGSSTPMGTANVCSGGAPTPCSTTTTLTFTFGTGGTIKAPAVLTQGSPNLDFTDAGTGTCTTNGTSFTYAAGATCTVVVTFAPKVPGARAGAVNLLNSSGTVIATALVSGTGTAPLALFQPGVLQTTYSTTLGAGRSPFVDAAGNVFISDQNNSRILKYPAGSTTPVVVATVNSYPEGVAVDGSGNVFFGAYGLSAPGIYEVAAGTTTPVMINSSITGCDNNMSIDGSGNLYLTEFNAGTIYKLPAGNYANAITLIAGVSGRRFTGMALDANGNLFAADTPNNVLYELVAGSTSLTTLASGAPLATPVGVAVDAADNIYVVNASGTGVLRYAAGHYSNTPATLSATGQFGIALGSDGSLYTVYGQTTLYRYTRSTNPPLAFSNTAVGTASATQNVTFENDGNATLSMPGIGSSNANFTFLGGQANGSTPACGTSLAPAGFCNIASTFTPQSATALTGTGSVADNNLNVTNSSTTVALSGTGTPGTKNITFPQPPAQNAGTSYTLTATASNGDPVTYSITSGPATVSGSVVTYTGGGSVVIAANSAATANYNAAATVSDTVAVTVAKSYTAPTTAVGSTSATQTAYLTFTTAGTPATIRVLTQGSTGLDYAFVSGGTCSTTTAYTVGQSCSVLYSFTPVAPGQRKGGITLSTSGGTVLGTSYLAGTGTGPQAVFVTPTITSLITGAGVTFYDVVEDGAGDIYVGTASSIYRYPSGSTSRTVVATNATTGALGIDGVGNVYYNNGAALWQIPGGTGTPIQVTANACVAYQQIVADGSGNIYLPCRAANDVIELAAGSYALLNTFGSGTISAPAGLSLDPNGNMYVSDDNNNKIWKITQSNVVTAVASISNPQDNLFDPAGNLIVANNTTTLTVYAPGFGSSTTITGVTTGGGAFGIYLTPAGNVVVTDTNGNLNLVNRNTPPGLTFPNTAVGTNSPPQSVAIQNVGNASLSLVSLTTSNNNFIAALNSCSFSPLPSGASCTVSFAMLPMSTGPLTGNGMINDTSLNGSPATQTIALSGTGTAGTKTITFPQPPSQVAGTQYTLTATASNGDPVTYSITSGPATVSGSVITYTGAGSVVIAANSAATTTYNAAATVSDTVTVTAAPTAFTAPTTAVGTTSATQTVQVTFTTAGTPGTIRVLTQGSTGLDYAFVSGGTCSTTTAYTAGQTCTVQYSFTPIAPGQRKGGITLSNSSGTALATSYLSGTGTGPQAIFNKPTISSIVTGAGANFYDVVGDGAGDLYVGTSANIYRYPAGSATKTVVATNQTNGGLGIDGAGNVYYVHSAALWQVPGGTGTPIQVNANACQNNQQIAVDGSGNIYVSCATANEVLEFSAGTYTLLNTFGSGMIGPATGLSLDPSGNMYVSDSNNNKIWKITPANVATAVITGIATPQDTAFDAAGDLIVANATTTLTVYAPGFGSSTTITGVDPSGPGVLGIYLNAAGNIVAADVNGSLNLVNRTTPPALAFASTAVGATSAAQTLTAQNIGNASLTIASIAPSSSNFTFAGSGCGSSLASAASCTLSATFTPQSAGTLTGSGIVTDNSLNATGSTQTVALSGTGSYAQPTITSTAPSSGPAAGGTTVTVTGTNLNGITAVKFGTVAASSFTLVSSTSLTAVSPAGTGVVDITVANPGSASATSTADQFSYQSQTQTITFTQPTTPAYVGTTATLVATGGASGSPVTFSIVSGPATLSGTNNSVITYTGTGTVIIAADQAAGGTYAAAAEVTHTVTVAQQSIFVANSTGGVSSYLENGSVRSSTAYYGGIGVAVDTSGYVWSLNASGTVVKFNDAGTAVASYAFSSSVANAIAIDGNGIVLFLNSEGTISGLAQSGQLVFKNPVAAAAGISNPTAFSIDTAGSIWIASSGDNSVVEIIGVAAPVVTPFVKAVIASTPGTRP